MGIKFKDKTSVGSPANGDIAERELCLDLKDGSVYSSTNGLDIVKIGGASNKENFLGVPLTNGLVLVSDTAGNRTWTAFPPATNIVDSLVSTSTTDSLSANQGKILDTTKANLASPTFTGIPQVPDAVAGTADASIANTKFVSNAVKSNVIDNVTSVSVDSALSANQGKLLNDKVVANTTKITQNITDIATNKADIATLKSFGAYKGTFTTLATRDAALPTPNDGDYVLVSIGGVGAPYHEWIYDTASVTWFSGGVVNAPTSMTVVDNLLSTSATDTLSANQGKVLDAAKENVLGNPVNDGDVLSSTILGVRSWITPLVPTARGGIEFNPATTYLAGDIVSIIDATLPVPFDTERRVYVCITGHGPSAWTAVKGNWDDIANGGTY